MHLSPPVPIVCIDSGIGGLHIFKALRLLLPYTSHLYIADYAGFPYGDKAPAQLIQRLAKIIEKTVDFFRTHSSEGHAPLFVLACNTATATAISTLREQFNTLSFIGCIPAIKPACEHTHSGTVALLATPTTCAQPAIAQLIRTHQKHQTVLTFPMRTLAQLAEQYATTPSSHTTLKTELDEALVPLLTHPEAIHIDHVILGCTHYRFLLPELQQRCPSHWTWIDATEGVARHACDTWKQMHTTEVLQHHAPAPSFILHTHPIPDESEHVATQITHACYTIGLEKLPILQWDLTHSAIPLVAAATQGTMP